MKVEIVPAVTVFAAGFTLAVGATFPVVQTTENCVDAHGTERGSNATSSWEGGTVVTMTLPQMPQDYYWTPAWQTEEQAAVEELNSGDFVEFENVDDLFAWLDEPEA